MWVFLYKFLSPILIENGYIDLKVERNNNLTLQKWTRKCVKIRFLID